MDFIKEKLKKLPLTPGVYIMKDKFGNIIYIGKAKRLKNRVSQYFVNKTHTDKVKSMVSNVADFEYILTNTELDALMLECNLIKKYQPFYNILLKDGKQYPYIKVDLNDDFPRLEVVRKVKKGNAKYFGPYYGVSPKEIINAVNYAYPIRNCSKKIKANGKPKKECLNYAMGLCSAPCAGKITKEEYAVYLPKVYDFLSGKDSTVYETICKKMDQAIEVENFELAIKLRDLKFMLQKLREKSVTALTSTDNIDVFGYAKNDFFYVFSVLIIRSGKMMAVDTFSFDNNMIDDEQMLISFLTQYYTVNALVPEKIMLPFEVDKDDAVFNMLSQRLKKQLTVTIPERGKGSKLVEQANNNAKEYLTKNCMLESIRKSKKLEVLSNLQKVLGLKNLPMRIECYDISNISGTNSVCSMVVFIGGSKASKHYRKFKIKNVIGPNDFESLYESISRRLDKLDSDDISFSSLPSVILIDGGEGQINKCREMIKSYNPNIDVISLAKREEEIFVEDNPVSVKLSKDTPELKLLQNVRDEAHRFAITFHRSLRKKHATDSILDEIEGLGKTKKQALMDKFKSVKKMKKATAEDLISVSGITPKIASEIIKKLDEID